MKSAVLAIALLLVPTLDAAQPLKNQSLAKLTPANPKGGDLLTVTTDAENALFDFDGVFSATSARQVGKDLHIALPRCNEAKVYVIRCIYAVEKKIIIEKIEIKVAGEAEDVKPKPLPSDDAAKQLKILTDAILAQDKRIEAQIDVVVSLSTVVMSLSKRVASLEKQDPRPPPIIVVKHLTFIGLTAMSAPIVNDATIRMTLKDAGIEVHLYASDTDPFVKASGLYKGVAAAGGMGKCGVIVLQNATGEIVDQTQMTTVDDARLFVKKHIK